MTNKSHIVNVKQLVIGHVTLMNISRQVKRCVEKVPGNIRIGMSRNGRKIHSEENFDMK